MKPLKHIATIDETKQIGTRIGEVLRGGEMIELVGDVGAGKTTLTKGLALGLGIDEDVQSPTFTISREYSARDGLQLHHYDFYRLNDPGVVMFELAESIADPQVVTVVEWGGSAEEVLPSKRIIIELHHEADEQGRTMSVNVPDTYRYIEDAV